MEEDGAFEGKAFKGVEAGRAGISRPITDCDMNDGVGFANGCPVMLDGFMVGWVVAGVWFILG